MSGSDLAKPLNRLTVAELKAELAKRDLPLSVSDVLRIFFLTLCLISSKLLPGSESRARDTFARSYDSFRCCSRSTCCSHHF